MATHRYIYWRSDIPKKDGKRFANVHLLVGYNQRTISDYRQMGDELRKIFPEATEGDIRCESVRKSSYCQEFSVVAYDAYIPEGDYPEWQQIDGPTPEYYF